MTGILYAVLGSIIIIGFATKASFMTAPIVISLLLLYFLRIRDAFIITHGKFFDSKKRRLESSMPWSIIIYFSLIPDIFILSLVINIAMQQYNNTLL